MPAATSSLAPAAPGPRIAAYFNRFPKALLYTVIFRKLRGELPMLHQVPVERSRGLKATKPRGAFERSLVGLILIHRAPHDPKAHMQEFDLKAFSDASFGARLRCCDDRF